MFDILGSQSKNSLPEKLIAVPPLHPIFLICEKQLYYPFSNINILQLFINVKTIAAFFALIIKSNNFQNIIFIEIFYKAFVKVRRRSISTNTQLRYKSIEI